MAAVLLRLHTDRLLISWLGSLSCALIKSVNGIDGAIASTDCWVFSKWQENRHSSLRAHCFHGFPFSFRTLFHSHFILRAFPLVVSVQHYTAETELRRFITVRKAGRMDERKRVPAAEWDWLRQTQCRNRWQMFPSLSSVTYLLTRYSPPFLAIHLYSGCVCLLLSPSGPHSHSRWKLPPNPSSIWFIFIFFLSFLHTATNTHPHTHCCCCCETAAIGTQRRFGQHWHCRRARSKAGHLQYRLTSLLALFPQLAGFYGEHKCNI